MRTQDSFSVENSVSNGSANTTSVCLPWPLFCFVFVTDFAVVREQVRFVHFFHVNPRHYSCNLVTGNREPEQTTLCCEALRVV